MGRPGATYETLNIHSIEFVFGIGYIGRVNLQRGLPMTLDRTVLAFAGVMTLLSVVLTLTVSPLFVWFTAFIGVNMLQSAFTGFCPAAMIFKKLGIKPGCAF